MPRKSFPCAYCGEDFQPCAGSLPPGEAMHRECRNASGGRGSGRRHGFRATYDAGCRCRPCKDAVNEASRKYRAKRNSEGRPISRTSRTVYVYNCTGCGAEFSTADKKAKYCSIQCAGKNKPKPRIVRKCSRCGSSFTAENSAAKYCSDECRNVKPVSLVKAPVSDLRSPIRKAWEGKDYPALIAAIKSDAVVKGDCWIWTRRCRDGYPEARLGKKTFGVHRLALEAKHGKPLGSQAAHHVCANSMCVNPDHLQPVTHRENSAEMLARHSYLNRIKELETALAELDPNHELLNVIDVA